MNLFMDPIFYDTEVNVPRVIHLNFAQLSLLVAYRVRNITKWLDFINSDMLYKCLDDCFIWLMKALRNKCKSDASSTEYFLPFQCIFWESQVLGFQGESNPIPGLQHFLDKIENRGSSLKSRLKWKSFVTIMKAISNK